MIFRFLVLVFSQTHLSIPESQSKKAVQRDFRLPVFSSSHISNLPGPLNREKQSGVIYHFAADKVTSITKSQQNLPGTRIRVFIFQKSQGH